LFSITVAPTIVVSNAISTSLQGNVGNAFALSGFGSANAAVGQLNGLLGFTASAA
jgi:hypothetical protein